MSKTANIIQQIQQSFEDPALNSKAKEVNKVFQFDVKTSSGSIEKFYIDCKQGTVKTGTAEKADSTLTLSEDDFEGLVSQTTNAQKLYMTGKLKIKGNLMATTKLAPLLKRPKAKL